MSISLQDVYKTIEMSSEDSFDIRTTTLGINLLPFVHSDFQEFLSRVQKHIETKAKNLTKITKEVSIEYGIPIINKRITITPASILLANHFTEDTKHNTDICVRFAKTLDESTQKLGIDFIGGFGGFVELGESRADKAIIQSLPDVLSETKSVCSFLNVATSKQGINMDAVYDVGKMIVALSRKSENAIGCAKFVVFSNAVPDSPFMAGGFYGIQNGDASLHVGLSGPGVIRNVLKSLSRDLPLDQVANEIKKTSFKLVRAGELIGKRVAEKLDVDFGSVDVSLAPTTAVGDSVGEVLELIGVEKVGTHGTTAALAMLTDAVKQGGIAASANIGGFSGAFIPVSEDTFLSNSVQEGVLTLDKLEAMTTVCSVGLDMVAIPGDTPAETISGIIADEMAIGVMNNKTTGARIIPAPGKKAGEHIDFGGLLGRACVIKVHNIPPNTFIRRGGKIPSSLTSFRN